MGAYILRRLLLVIPTLLGIMILNFALTQFVPGGPIETIIAPGDSGGPALRQTADGWEVVGINTFTQGRGGRFGDTGGGIVLAPYEDWINTTTGIPEPGVGMVLVLGLLVGLVRRRRRVDQD